MFRLKSLFVAASLGLGALTSAFAHTAEPTLIFAAASLKNALDGVSAAWQADTGKKATISYAASSALAKQIEEKAPADIFFSADLTWMDYLDERSLIKKDSRVTLLGTPPERNPSSCAMRRSTSRTGMASAW